MTATQEVSDLINDLSKVKPSIILVNIHLFIELISEMGINAEESNSLIYTDAEWGQVVIGASTAVKSKSKAIHNTILQTTELQGVTK